MGIKQKIIKLFDTRVPWKTAAAAPYYWAPYNFTNGYALPPLAVTFEVTYICNLQCEMCSQWQYRKTLPTKQYSSKGELTTEEWCGLVDELKHVGTRKITTTGGEPFVRKDLGDIIRYICSKNIYSTIITNGTLMRESDAEMVLDSGLDHIVFSIDGPPGIHDKVRGVKGTFDKMIKSLRTLSDLKRRRGAKKPWIRVNHAIHADTASHLSEIFDVIGEVKVDAIHFNYLFFTDENSEQQTNLILRENIGGVKMEDQRLPDELKKVNYRELDEQIALCKRFGDENGSRIQFSPALKGDEIRSRFEDPDYVYANKCFSAWYRGRINPYGSIYPCSIDMDIANVRDGGFMKHWNGDAYREFRQDLKKAGGLFPVCRRCCVLNSKLWNILPKLT